MVETSSVTRCGQAGPFAHPANHFGDIFGCKRGNICVKQKREDVEGEKNREEKGKVEENREKEKKEGKEREKIVVCWYYAVYMLYIPLLLYLYPRAQ